MRQSIRQLSPYRLVTASELAAATRDAGFGEFVRGTAFVFVAGGSSCHVSVDFHDDAVRPSAVFCLNGSEGPKDGGLVRSRYDSLCEAYCVAAQLQIVNKVSGIRSNRPPVR